jgi:hypothetical protein
MMGVFETRGDVAEEEDGASVPNVRVAVLAINTQVR